MEMIQKRDQKFDQTIDLISQGVEQIGQLAIGLNEELTTQEVMVDNLSKKIDDAGEHLESINSKMKKTLKEASRPADKLCVDIICLVILLGVASVLYNMYKEQQRGERSS